MTATRLSIAGTAIVLFAAVTSALEWALVPAVFLLVDIPVLIGGIALQFTASRAQHPLDMQKSSAAEPARTRATVR